MKTIITVLLIISFSDYLIAQGTQPIGSAVMSLDVSNIKPTILTGGDMFHDLQRNNPNIPYSFNQGFEVPRGSNRHTLFAGSLWIGGKDIQNNLYVAAQTYRQGSPQQNGFWPGPITNNHNATHSLKYDKIWKIDKSQIQDHIANYFRPNYKVPADISSWPGNGNTGNGEAATLAPFIDLNKNGIYEPGLGDYPDILGDQALYLILNDKGNIKVPASPTMNTEIHVMYYGFDNPADTAVYNTLFCQYRIINRGKTDYNNFYCGIWADLEIGYYNDDYLGCDTLNNRFYGFNGDNYDEGPKGYGYHPPVQSIIFLDQRMSHFMYYNNSMDFVNGIPTEASNFYNYLRGYWRNNTPLTYGEDGTNQNNIPTTHMFTGDPDAGIGWTEFTPFITGPGSNIPGDRRGVGSIGPFNFRSGEEIKFTVGYTFSRQNSPGSGWIPSSFSRPDVKAVQTFFKNQVLNAPHPKLENGLLKLFPNPVAGPLFVKLPDEFAGKNVMLKILDNTGRELLSATFPQASPDLYLDVKSLKAGIYMTQIISGNQILTSRLVKL